MNQTQQNGPNVNNSSGGCGNKVFMFLWAIFSIGALYLIASTWLCEKFGFLRSANPMSCGSDSAGIPTIIGFAMLGLWTLISLVIFLVAKKRIPAYIFGGLLLIEIIYVALNIHF